jgi:hypothetical protein
MAEMAAGFSGYGHHPGEDEACCNQAALWDVLLLPALPYGTSVAFSRRLQRPSRPYPMTIQPDPKKPIFEDADIRITLNAFNELTRLAAAYVHEKKRNVGSYRILFRFASGHEASVKFDGGDRYRTAFLTVSTPHKGDGIAGLEVCGVAG